MPTFRGEPTTMWKLIRAKRMPPTRIVRYCCKFLKETATPKQIAVLGVRADESSNRRGRDTFVVRGKEHRYYSLEHATEVYGEAQERDEVWDCKLISSAKQNDDLIVNPIYEWTNSDVWRYLRENSIETNPLYEQGEHRVGCVLCPMVGTRGMRKDAKRFQKFAQAYIHAFQRMIDDRKADGLETVWDTGQECFDWWIGTDQIAGQMNISDFLESEV